MNSTKTMVLSGLVWRFAERVGAQKERGLKFRLKLYLNALTPQIINTYTRIKKATIHRDVK